MLKGWIFTKNKICYRCFDNNLKKNKQQRKDAFDSSFNGGYLTGTSNGD